jgi:5-methylthioadenosine/S-adenosylhomocysteine deaminase
MKSTKHLKRDLYITDALVVTQNSKRDAFWGVIHVRDNCIQGIHKTLPSRAAQSKARVLSAKGCAVLPGFVQTHIHLCQTLFRNHADDLELLDWLKKRIWVFEAARAWESLNSSLQAPRVF